jgi:hypothetical protein
MSIRDVREQIAETVIGKRLRSSEIAHQTRLISSHWRY